MSVSKPSQKSNSSAKCEHEFMLRVDEANNQIIVFLNGRKIVMPLIKEKANA